ncbi:glycosyltransferase [uncultured Pontibacter sp.]|uniref:glycosyltransferase n=1 Tax=uncultured Pontibacter sp. TaxID=453356 RepID=UPI002631B9DE|nr:glycosyltransferase [uncultured Pontibacter sp.]
MKHIHIVTFDVPFPANYGGVIDVFYRLKALSKVGVHVHLHCYENGREQSEELEKICYKVHYYKRSLHPVKLFDLTPFIVNTRANKALLGNLLKDNYPILFEGLHATHLLKHSQLQDRYKIVRAHNIEHEYYWHLCKAESNTFLKLFFATEAFKLKLYEHVLAYANVVLAITEDDRHYLKRYGKVVHIPAFHPDQFSKTASAIGKGVLYHGNLSVSENRKAVLYLLKNVFNKLSLPVIIAGKNPCKQILKEAAKLKHVTVKANPSDSEMLHYINEAQVNVLVTFQSTGIKLKLLNSLLKGRHCVVNNAMIEKTGLESTCTVANSPEAIVNAINELYSKPYTDTEHARRKSIFQELYSNQNSVAQIIGLYDESQAVRLSANTHYVPVSPKLAASPVLLSPSPTPQLALSAKTDCD